MKICKVYIFLNCFKYLFDILFEQFYDQIKFCTRIIICNGGVILLVEVQYIR